MIRKIVNIDDQKCNGCGLCVEACHEGALVLENGKAKLTSEAYCDGLGDCLPACPTGAIIIEEREADPFDEEAVQKQLDHKNKEKPLACGCPGTQVKAIKNKSFLPKKVIETTTTSSQLGQWPCQIKLVPPNAPFFNNASLLIAADCTAYAYANIHKDFMQNKITLIGCPKLDDTNYAEKLTAILQRNEIKNITILRMDVPCCGGITQAVKTALINSGKMIPWQVVTISTDGSILE